MRLLEKKAEFMAGGHSKKEQTVQAAMLIQTNA